MQLRDKNPALLLVDLQVGFKEEEYWGGNRNNKNAEEVCAAILKEWRKLKLPIIHVIHSSQNPESKLHEGHPGFAFQEITKPNDDEPVLIKNVNSAFIGTGLKERLESQGIDTVVIIGLTTNHCISTTTRMSGNLGFNTYLISDATATFDRIGINGERYDSEIIHMTTLASLHEEFATVMSAEDLLAQI